MPDAGRNSLKKNRIDEDRQQRREQPTRRHVREDD
jgi:hypothetical protein